LFGCFVVSLFVVVRGGGAGGGGRDCHFNDKFTPCEMDVEDLILMAKRKEDRDRMEFGMGFMMGIWILCCYYM
jgi:hypothetical protein